MQISWNKFMILFFGMLGLISTSLLFGAEVTFIVTILASIIIVTLLSKTKDDIKNEVYS